MGVKELGDIALLSRCVSFSGKGTGKAAEEAVMFNKGCLAEDIPLEFTAADLEQYWQRPLGSAWNMETFFWRSSGSGDVQSQSRPSVRSRTPGRQVRVHISAVLKRW